jgi:hypothetical protein
MQCGPVYRYGMLIVGLLLLIIAVWNLHRLSPAGLDPRHTTLPVALMVLFVHLSQSFRWPSGITIALRLLGLLSIAATLCLSGYFVLRDAGV